MTNINTLLNTLDERTIAQRVSIPHDEVRMRYSLDSNTVRDFDEFSDVIADYYNTHFTACVSNGGNLSRAEAFGRAKEILIQNYRRRNGDIVTAYNDAHDGTNGGLNAILNTIAEALKAKSVETYIEAAFDRHVSPNQWEQKVEIIRQFIEKFHHVLGSNIQAHQPERYAQNYTELIQSYVNALQQTSSVFRRL